jgi:beta-phosphoglucomutase-like phosphatase (HAD superfamily)
MKTKAIIFDLDGVLVDMPNGHYEALNNALKLFGAQINYDEHMTHFNGLPTRKKLERLEQEERLPQGLREFINTIKQHHTKDVIPRYCPPDYAKILMLTHLKKRGYKLACCSNSIQETLHLMLKSAHLFDFFDLIIGNDEVTHPKPHPEMYLLAFERLGVKPQEAVIVEDSPHGIAAAKASGARVIEVRNIEDVHLDLFKDFT